VLPWFLGLFYVVPSTKTGEWILLRVHTEHWQWFSVTFQNLFMCVFPGLSRTIYVQFPRLSRTVRVEIEQVRFSDTCTKSTKQQIKPSLTVDNDNVCKGRKQVHGSEMQQPFGLFFMTFHDFPGPRPNSMTFQAWKIWTLNIIHHIRRLEGISYFHIKNRVH